MEIVVSKNFFQKTNEIILRISDLYHLFNQLGKVKFGYSERATKFEKIFNLKFDVTEYFKWKIFSNFAAFSEYPNFIAQ